MAAPTKYTSKAGTRWKVQYRKPDGTPTTKRGFTTKAEATRWAAKNTSTIDEGDWIDPQRAKTTIDSLAVPWLASLARLKPSSQRVIKLAWENHVKPRWGGVAASQVKYSDVVVWVTSMQADLGATSIRRNHNALSQILDMAVKDGVIKKNVAAGVALPKKPAPKKIYLTESQLAALAAESKYPEIVWLLGTVGLRWGELAGVQVDDVNVLRCRILIARNAVTVGGEVVVGTPKSHEVRSVAVPKSVMRLVAPLLRGRAPDAFVWSVDGQPMKLPSTSSWFEGAVVRCREKDADFPRVTPHGLRHTAASLMISAGANPKVVQRQLGHASAAHTLDVYADLFDSDLDSVGAAIDGRVSPLVGGLG